MWHLLGVFLLIAGGLFAADLWAHRKADKPTSLGNAAGWTCAYIAGAFAFMAYLGFTAGNGPAALFLTGFVMEKALSVDNLMVFVAIFSYFKIPDAYQHRVLHYGIIGAVVFRLLFVTVGAGALEAFGAPVALFFGLVVVWSAFKMWTATDGGDEPVDYANQWYIRWMWRWIMFTNDLPGPVFFKREMDHHYRWHRNGTVLLMCLVAIEISDVLFSFDSVPAVIAVTREPVLVYTAMIFAVLGLRQLYFILTALLRFPTRLEGAVVLVLFYIGIKLVVEALDAILPRFGIFPPGNIHIGPMTSLAVVVAILAGGIIASLVWPEKAEA